MKEIDAETAAGAGIAIAVLVEMLEHSGRIPLGLFEERLHRSLDVPATDPGCAWRNKLLAFMPLLRASVVDGAPVPRWP
ncbi:MAG: hypothetical protein FD160_3762 [Caulobacteraceae bacterium]|nr:MAG: hypothetical protein FD160_3762 [Caulobacteraceae bacterium]